MSLRDYFAAKAMAAYIQILPEDAEPEDYRGGIARASYSFADAMLAERVKAGEK